MRAATFHPDPRMDGTVTNPSDLENLKFQYYPTETLYRCQGDRRSEPCWGEDLLERTQDVLLPAAAAVLSYGYGVIEGLKAERTADGHIMLFRAADHGARFAHSAERLLMPAFPVERFVGAVEAVVRANERFVPPAGKGTFYLRPMQHGTEARLGLGKLNQYAVTIYGSPVGSYFGASGGSGLRLKVLEMGRAAPGGTGNVKSMSNYAGGLYHRESAQAEGFHDVLYLDARECRYVEETSGSNFYCLLRSGTLVTPALNDTILAGITRDSALQIARRRLHLKVEERPLPIEEVLEEGAEVFCTGTAWTIQAVAELCYQGRNTKFSSRELGAEIRRELRGIQSGGVADPFGWTYAIDMKMKTLQGRHHGT